MDLVWYVAYGSNLAADRLQCYFDGVIPDGATRGHPPGPDPTPPRRIEPLTIGHRLYFARSSSTWGSGGVAFVEPESQPTMHTLARAYLITEEQLADLWDKEGRRWYDRAVDLGELDGARLFSFTSSTVSAAKPPSRPYRNVVVRGLVEAHGLDVEAAEAYVDERIGAPSASGDGHR